MRFIYLLALILPVLSRAQLSFYPNHTLTVSGGVSTACFNALDATIQCDPYLVSLATADDYTTLNNDTVQKSVCDPQCGSELSRYQSSVKTACAQDPMPWPDIPATYFGDFVWAYYNGSCLRDPATGVWCKDYISTISSTLTGEFDITGLPKAQLCSPCITGLFKHQQSTAFSNYDNNMAAQWVSVQGLCGTSAPTDVQAPYVTVVDKPGHAPLNSSLSTPTCLSGRTYTVQTGDDPQKIAVANQVSTGTLRIINDILPDGSNLTPGLSICLPYQCMTHLLQSAETCWSLASSNGIGFSEFLAYNPSVNNDCSNLQVGSNVCVSLPGPVWNQTALPGASVTKTGQLATSTVAIPANAAPKTTRRCGKWYTVQEGDYCQIVALKKEISLDLFTAINPSLDAKCGNLQIGLSYCVWPTADWNALLNQISVPAPTSTPSGTTNVCYQWYVVKKDDSCYQIQQAYEITQSQLRGWNPDLREDCGNLLLDTAYCVSGPAPGTTPTPTPMAPPGPTQAGITAKCNKYVLQKNGVFCADMANAANIVLDQLYAWNPALGTDCTGLWVGYAYCVGVGS